jgi:hypothetical protein
MKAGGWSVMVVSRVAVEWLGRLEVSGGVAWHHEQEQRPRQLWRARVAWTKAGGA